MSVSPNGPVVRTSVIIVNWNTRETLRDCLHSLQDFPPPEPWDVIVIDNGSSDGSVDMLRRDEPWVRVIGNRENRGLPAANNQGIAASSGDALLICNPDVIFQDGAASAMVELLDRRPDAGMVIPRLLYEDGELQTSAGDLPSLADTLLGRQAQRRRDPGSPSGFWWDGWPHDEERPIGRGHEAAYVVRRQAVAEVGLQDEGYPLDWEGIDWTARFRDAGWNVWLCPKAEVVHLGGKSIRQVPFRWVITSHRGLYRYFAKRRPAYWRPFLAILAVGRATLKMAAIAAGAPMYQRAHRDPKATIRENGENSADPTTPATQVGIDPVSEEG
jgi:GT2 family glycosyltransferase